MNKLPVRLYTSKDEQLRELEVEPALKVATLMARKNEVVRRHSDDVTSLWEGLGASNAQQASKLISLKRKRRFMEVVVGSVFAPRIRGRSRE